MKQYLSAVQRIVDEGMWVENKRTGERCLTVINVDMEYNVGAGEFPMVTTRKVNPRAAIAELLGYLRGCSSAAEFRALGTRTWDANANENKAWLANPNRKGTDDMGRVYGTQLVGWQTPDGKRVNQLQKVYDHLKAGIDDRGEILSMWNPGEFHLGCLRPCMYEHQFSLLGDTLYLNSTQRSNDILLGGVFNAIQVYTLLALMAQITGHKPGIARHRSVNTHIYEPQYEVLMREGQLTREPYPAPTLKINPSIKTLEDVLTWVTVDDFVVEEYQHHPAIVYPFSV